MCERCIVSKRDTYAVWWGAEKLENRLPNLARTLEARYNGGLLAGPLVQETSVSFVRLKSNVSSQLPAFFGGVSGSMFISLARHFCTLPVRSMSSCLSLDKSIIPQQNTAELASLAIMWKSARFPFHIIQLLCMHPAQGLLR